jgi:3-oxoacyl-[acyl-carrier protein] reductase
MDLGIRGRKAIVCASSKGLGRACAEALAEAGVDLVINARHGEELDRIAAAIRKASAVKVTAVAADIASEAGRKAVLAACPEPDILVNNAGGPPPGDFRAWGRAEWLAALDANMLTPIELIKATVDGMIARGFGRIVNITSSAVKAPIESLGLSNGARSGLTGFVAGLARKTVRHNVTINSLLPGAFATDRLEAFIQNTAKSRGLSRDAAVAALEAASPAGRFGRPPEFGAACAFLCSAHAGYITGQNWLLDGGEYPGTY